jgi:ribosomal protein S18 acetylase RimI-like enzyme
MKYRLANILDAETLASIHFDSSRKQVGGFMHNLGLPFLKIYYRIHLKEKNSIILVAEDENKYIYGFVSGTLDADLLLNAFRKNRIKLFWSILPVILRSPKILNQVKERYNFILLRGDYVQFGINKGPRMDYWAWRPLITPNMSVFLLKKWFDHVFARGINSVKGEVDIDNNNIQSIYFRFGARVIKEMKLKDGRDRIFIEFLNDKVNTGYTIRNMCKADLNYVVEIHKKAFFGFFLTLMGRNFLYDLYKNFITDDFSICFVAEQDQIVKGFVVGNLKPNVLFRKMLIKQGFIFLWHSFNALFRKPSLVFRRLFYALNYRGAPPNGYINPALLSSIGVEPGEGTKGIGSHLIRAFCWEAFSKGSDVVYLTTDKFGNDKVNSFYLKNGFQIEDTIEEIKGRIMNRYIKLPDEKNF